MKIYTKQGDKGKTSVYTNDVLKLDKDDLILECYGTLDELNANIGLIASLLEANKIDEKWRLVFENCQRELFTIGFAISDNDNLHSDSIGVLESHIDSIQSQLPAQTSFILPGGSAMASNLHICRTVCRRAERRLVSLSKAHKVNDIALGYLNRLSDFLFVFARFSNHIHGTKDIAV